VRLETLAGYDVAYVACEFEKGGRGKLVFDGNNRLRLFFLPPRDLDADKLPAYVKPSSYVKAKCDWRSPLAIAGYAHLPPDAVRFRGCPRPRLRLRFAMRRWAEQAVSRPCVGAASQGIGVLRYEKRTKQYPRLARRSRLDGEGRNDRRLPGAVSWLRQQQQSTSADLCAWPQPGRHGWRPRIARGCGDRANRLAAIISPGALVLDSPIIWHAWPD